MNTGGGIRQPTIRQRRSEHTAAEITYWSMKCTGVLKCTIWYLGMSRLIFGVI